MDQKNNANLNADENHFNVIIHNKWWYGKFIVFILFHFIFYFSIFIIFYAIWNDLNGPKPPSSLPNWNFFQHFQQPLHFAFSYSSILCID